MIFVGEGDVFFFFVYSVVISGLIIEGEFFLRRRLWFVWGRFVVDLVDLVDVVVFIEVLLFCDFRLVKLVIVGFIVVLFLMDGIKFGKLVDYMFLLDRILFGCGWLVMCGEFYDGLKGWVVNLIFL